MSVNADMHRPERASHTNLRPNLSTTELSNKGGRITLFFGPENREVLEDLANAARAAWYDLALADEVEGVPA